MSRRTRVIIIGAGFAGLQVAQQLANTNLEVVLIDRKNYHTFQPLLHQVATAELEPQQVAYPIRLLLRHAKNIRFVMADVQHIWFAERAVVTEHAWFAYDFLVIGRWSLTGFIAWCLWLIVHVVLLRGYRQRLLTLFNWLASYGWSERAAQVSFRLTQFDSLTK